MKALMILFFIPTVVFGESYNVSCTGTQNVPAVTAYNHMTDRLSISPKTIDDSKTIVRLIDRQPITPLMGGMIVDRKMKQSQLDDEVQRRKILTQTYLEMKIYALTIKVNFENYAGSKNTFIVTTYISDGECSIGDGGMIMINRGF